MDVKGVATIVTGGGTGMGFAAAQALSRAGARVTLLGLQQEDVIKKAAEKIGGLGISCDVSVPESVERALAKANETHGAARILINSAGDGRIFPMLDLQGRPHPIETFHEIIGVNLFGPFYTIRLVASEMIKLKPIEDGSRGLIINVSSVGSQDGATNAVAYVASKGALDAWTLALAREFGNWGIRVLTVSPGLVLTPMVEDHLPKEALDMIAKTQPFPKRPGFPEEFGKLVMHICENTYLNGEIIRFNGGMRVSPVELPE